MIKDIKNSYRPNIAISIAGIKDGKLLLGKRQESTAWGFPNGSLKQGESIEECALRELSKETGLKSMHVQLGPWSNALSQEGEHCIFLHIFVHCVGEIESKKNAIHAWKWFDWNALPDPLSSAVRGLILTMGLNKLKELSCFPFPSLQHVTYPITGQNAHPLIVKLFSK